MGLICVTGMHRGGTSVLARAVNLLGVDLGPDRWLLPSDDDNPRGYWEDNRVVQLDDQLLGFLGGWWHRPPPLAAGWADAWELEPFRVWAAQLVADRADILDAGRLAGFKDPRLCLLLPLWRYATAIDHVVIAVRDPREVVASLGRRDGLDPEAAARLWLRYTAEGAVNAPEALAVRYDDWFADLVATAARVADHLGAEPPDDGVVDELGGFVTASLRRSTDPAPGGGPCLAAAVEVYDRLSTGPVAGAVDDLADRLASLAELPAEPPEPADEP